MDEYKASKEKSANSTHKQKDLDTIDAYSYYSKFGSKFSACYDLRDLKSKILTTVKQLGFSDFMFIRLERQWQAGSNSGLLHSFPKEMIEDYQHSHLYTQDLLLSYGRANSQPIFGSQIYDYIEDAPFEMELTTKNRQLRKFYRRYYYSEQLALPARSTNGNGNVLLLLTSEGKSKEEIQDAAAPVIALCQVLCRAIDAVTSRKFKSAFIDAKDAPLHVTPRALNVLRALTTSDAKIEDIAEKLKVKPVTIHQHLVATRRALNANTTVGAVVKAIKLGLVRL